MPSVATTSACVSPRVNSAEPCVRGKTPASATIGRTVLTIAAVDARAGIENVPADDLGLQIVEDFGDLLLGKRAFRPRRGKRRLTFALTASTRRGGPASAVIL